MKKLLAVIFSFFIGILTLTSCTKPEYAIIAEELDDDKFDYVEIYDEENNSNSIICNYVKSVWGDEENSYDVRENIIRYAYICDVNKNYKVNVGIPEDDRLNITSIVETSFINFDIDVETSREIDYDINDYTITINVDYKEVMNNHYFQYYKVNFKVDKTHFGYYYFGIRYGNELKSLKNTFAFLNDIKETSLEYIEMVYGPESIKIDDSDIQSTVINFINSLYTIKIDLTDYTITKYVSFNFKLYANEEIFTLQLDKDLICKYNNHYYLIIARNDMLKDYINTLVK